MSTTDKLRTLRDLDSSLLEIQEAGFSEDGYIWGTPAPKNYRMVDPTIDKLLAELRHPEFVAALSDSAMQEDMQTQIITQVLTIRARLQRVCDSRKPLDMTLMRKLWDLDDVYEAAGIGPACDMLQDVTWHSLMRYLSASPGSWWCTGWDARHARLRVAVRVQNPPSES